MTRKKLNEDIINIVCKCPIVLCIWNEVYLYRVHIYKVHYINTNKVHYINTI